MSPTFAVTQTYTIICCNHEGCGLSFALNDDFIAARRRDHKTWYCPNGHSRYYPEKNETELAQARAARLERQLANKDEDLRATRASLIATKGVVTKTKKRIANGVCPCCNRSFADLGRHMAGQHPDYAEASTS